MKRSTINAAVREAQQAFAKHHWHLPPNPRWDVTDFGLGEFDRYGLLLINLAEEPEYCEKLMYAREGQETPAHAHKVKKEDIIVRQGALRLKLWLGEPDLRPAGEGFTVQVNNESREVKHGGEITLHSGERITLIPGVYHAFWPVEGPCIIGEVSTANDDANDNNFKSIYASPEATDPLTDGVDRVTVEGEALSLDDIEHEIMRPTFEAAMVHYAVNCASIGCPNLKPDAWRAETLQADLTAAARAYVNHPRGVAIVNDGVEVSRIYRWFREDFGGDEEGVIAHVLLFAEPELAEHIRSHPEVRGHQYDWALNRVAAD